MKPAAHPSRSSSLPLLCLSSAPTAIKSCSDETNASYLLAGIATDPINSAAEPQASLALATQPSSSPPPPLPTPHRPPPLESRREPNKQAMALPPPAAAPGGPLIGTAPTRTAIRCASLSGRSATAAGRARTAPRPRRTFGRSAAAEGKARGRTGNRWWRRCTGRGFSWGESQGPKYAEMTYRSCLTVETFAFLGFLTVEAFDVHSCLCSEMVWSLPAALCGVAACCCFLPQCRIGPIYGR